MKYGDSVFVEHFGDTKVFKAIEYYIKGYKDCFRDQENNKKFVKNIDSLKCYIVDSQKITESINVNRIFV